MKTFVSLFAGIGGFDLGFEREGFKCVGQCEIDKFACKVLDEHWPEVPKHDDVTTLSANTFEYPDIVTFGSPCQDLSIGGSKNGLSGERSGLFTEAVRYIREVQKSSNGEYPKVAIWENVPGAFWSNKGEDFATVLSLLVGGEVSVPDKGWKSKGDHAGIAFGPQGSAEWRVLNSQHFRVPQRRRRIFLVYHPRGERAGQVLFECGGLRGDNQEVSARGETLARRAEANTTKNDFRVESFAWQAGGVSSRGHEIEKSGTLIANQTQAIYVKTSRATSVNGYKNWEPKELAPTLNVFDSSKSRATTLITNQFTETAATLTARMEKGFDSTMTSQTPIKTFKGVRKLTPLECERLQGFPDNWTANLSDTQRYKTLGNAVTVNVAQWIASRL